jgi:hypothetical protein
MDADVPDSAETNAHAILLNCRAILRFSASHRDYKQTGKLQHHLAVVARRIGTGDFVRVFGKERLA